MLKVDHIRCHYGDRQAGDPPVIEDVSFQMNESELCCLLGPSGCGKTTVLRSIAGFQSLTQGNIELNGTVLSSRKLQLAPELRQLGMVFQDYALFPHLTVRDNIRFGLSKRPRQEQQRRVDELLSLIQLDSIGLRYPHQLSGGQQQRVALARALAPSPKLLLLDEPFSNLDVELRRHLSVEVRDILKQFGTSAILVTHDQDEAFAFGDKIGLLYKGRLQQWDTPLKLFYQPANPFVASFIGQGNLLAGSLSNHQQIETALGVIAYDNPHNWPTATKVEVLLRPRDLTLCNDHDIAHGISTIIKQKVFAGSSTLYTLESASGINVDIELPSQLDFSVGDKISVQVGVQKVIAFQQP
ncbi:MAG: iron(III) transport system ATP-binding protein [Oceanicoccus sp.]